ncbi:MAG: hypothetical protein GC134_04870 [Proteobacteria bacterium]|nr:hypothetical protein [Pseudomonadota bacterium]
MTLPTALMTELPYRAALAGLFMVLGILRVVSHRQGGTLKETPFTQKEGRLIGLLRLVLTALTVGVALIYLAWPQAVIWAQIPLPASLRWMGAVLAVICLALFWWVNHTLGRNFSATLRIRDDHKLMTNGPYAYVRHPMYTVLFSMLLAFSLLAANWVSFLGGSALTLMITIFRTPKEEAMLRAAFGQAYIDYCAKTPRYFPSLSSLLSTN